MSYKRVADVTQSLPFGIKNRDKGSSCSTGLMHAVVVPPFLKKPSVPCLTDPKKACKVCLSTLKPEGVKNIKRNTSAMVHFTHEDGKERYAQQ